MSEEVKKVSRMSEEVKRLSKLLKDAYKFVSDNPDVWDARTLRPLE